MPLKKDCDMALSEKSRAILQAIAEGHTYEQILVQDLAWTYHDIFQAAAEALEAPQATMKSRATTLRKSVKSIPAPTRSGALRKTNNFPGFAETGRA